MGRIEPIHPHESLGAIHELLAAMRAERGFVPTLYATMAHSPGLLRDFVQMTGTFRTGTTFDGAVRELAILTVARATDSRVMWLAHVPLALREGVTEEQIVALKAGARRNFTNAQAVVIGFSERLTASPAVSDDEWAGVRAHFGERELVELTLLVGYYNMVARFLGALQFEVDEEYYAAVPVGLR